MLTKIETQVLFRVYTVCCKFYTTPFTWKDGRMVLTVNYKTKFFNYFTWILLIPMLVYNVAQLPVLIDKNDINALVLQGIFLMSYSGYAVCKFNIWLCSTEMVDVINQTLCINSAWGKYRVDHNHLSPSLGQNWGTHRGFYSYSNKK